MADRLLNGDGKYSEKLVSEELDERKLYLYGNKKRAIVAKMELNELYDELIGKIGLSEYEAGYFIKENSFNKLYEKGTEIKGNEYFKEMTYEDYIGEVAEFIEEIKEEIEYIIDPSTEVTPMGEAE